MREKLQLLLELKGSDKLPAILFSHNRRDVNAHMKIVLEKLLCILLPMEDTLKFVSLSLRTLLTKIQPPSREVEIHHFIGQLEMDT